MVRRIKSTVPTTRVIVDSRDASKDRVVPMDVAKRLHENGILSWDLTNKKYCVPTNGRLPLVLVNYAMVG